MKRFVVMLFWLASASCFGQDASIYQGIWQDINKPDRYFTIHENNQTLVLIYLEGVANNPDTLKSAYTGKLFLQNEQSFTFILSRFSPNPGLDIYNEVEVTFTSSTQGSIFPWVYSNIDAPLIQIRKVF